jgi:hypothetical protein
MRKDLQHLTKEQREYLANKIFKKISSGDCSIWADSEQCLNRIKSSLEIKDEPLSKTAVISLFSYEELQYMLVMLTEGQDKVNSSKAFYGFQNHKIQENIINKVRNECWKNHVNGQ